MPNYANGKIYIIRNTENVNVYVGSTVQTLCQRFADHMRHMKQEQNATIKLYQEMHRIGSHKFYIELIKYFPCGTKEELNSEEGRFIREYKSCGKNGLNTNLAGRLRVEYNKEYRKINLDKLTNYNQLYEKNMPDHVKTKRNARKATKMQCPHCETTLTKGCLSRHIKSKHPNDPSTSQS